MEYVVIADQGRDRACGAQVHKDVEACTQQASKRKLLHRVHVHMQDK